MTISFNHAVDQIYSTVNRYNLPQCFTSGFDRDGHVKPNDVDIRDGSHSKMQELLDGTYSVEERGAKLLVELGEQYRLTLFNATYVS